MKRYLRFGLPVIVAIMVAVITQAFTMSSSISATDPTELVYFKFDEQTQNLIPINPNSQEADPLPFPSNPFGCSGSIEICSQGFAPEDLVLDGNGMLIPAPGATVYHEHRRN